MIRPTPYKSEQQKQQEDIAKLKAITDLLTRMTAPESPEIMSTIKQIEANRQNALKSTGPKSTEGKAAVAQNALKHGLYASTLLLPEEDPAQYEALCQTYLDEYRPANLDQIDLVESIVSDKWELVRINLYKQGVFNKARKWLTRHDKKGEETHPSAAHICMEVGGDRDYNTAMARISQMEGRIQRHCERTRRELRKLQQATVGQALSPALSPANLPPQPEPPSPGSSEPTETT